MDISNTFIKFVPQLTDVIPYQGKSFMKKPQNKIEEKLLQIENLLLANQVQSYRFAIGESQCDICDKEIVGRHLFDALLPNTNNTWATMCSSCAFKKGTRLGEGKGQLYSKNSEGRWLLTAGFTAYDLESVHQN